jgi:hypothetical protein
MNVANDTAAVHHSHLFEVSVSAGRVGKSKRASDNERMAAS